MMLPLYHHNYVVYCQYTLTDHCIIAAVSYGPF